MVWGLDKIKETVSDGFDVARGAVQTVTQEVGDIAQSVNLPNPPGFGLHSFDIPGIDLPDIGLPDIDLPDIGLPDIDLPGVDLPDIDLPFSMPSIPSLPFSMPSIPSLPFTGGLPDLPTPANLPGLPDFGGVIREITNRVGLTQPEGPPAPNSGDVGGTFEREERVPFTATGDTDEALGRAAITRTLEDTANGEQIQQDEFELIEHENGNFTIVLPGVTDLSNPQFGLNPHNHTVRDVDQFALPSSESALTEDNRYAEMVREYILENVPEGADVMIVGHSYGADTALDLANDPVFNNADTGVNVTHVVAAAYYAEPQTANIQNGTEVLVLENQNDAAVIVEGLGHLRQDAGQLFEDPPSLGELPGFLQNIGEEVLDRGGSIWDRNITETFGRGAPGITHVDEDVTIVRFDGGTAGVGHAQENYIDYVNNDGTFPEDDRIADFYASVAEAGYGADGTSYAVDVSVPDGANHDNYIPGEDEFARLLGAAGDTAGDFADFISPGRDATRDFLVGGASDIWGAIPGTGIVETAAEGVFDRLPFNNAIETSARALLGQETITLDTDATDAIQADPGFISVENNIVAELRERHALEGGGDVTIDLADLDTGLGVELGGERGAFASLDPADHLATLGVAADELTWLLRHASLSGEAHITADGDITINYQIDDVLDLRPGEGRSDAYNAVTTVTGYLWHDLLGGEEANVTGNFTSVIPADEG